MHKLWSLVCLIFVAWLGFSQAQNTPILELTDDDYAIYSIILKEHFFPPSVEHLIIGDHTMMEFPPIMAGMAGFSDSREVKKLRDAVTKETEADYDAKNKVPVVLENKFSLETPVVLLSAADRDKIFHVRGEGDKKTADPKGMENLDRLYSKPQGFMSLSRIGFNKSRTQALVYAGNICGSLCGEGRVFLLVKNGNSWKIKYAATTWVS